MVGVYITCNDVVKKIYALHKRVAERWRKALFTRGIPACKNEQFPKEWIEHEIKINKIGITKCKRKCNIRQFPLMGTISGNIIATVKNNQKLFLKTRISTIPNAGYYETTHPGYRYWYSFSDQGNTYYIWEGSIQKVLN